MEEVLVWRRHAPVSPGRCTCHPGGAKPGWRKRLRKPPYPFTVQALLIGGVEADSARWETADSAGI